MNKYIVGQGKIFTGSFIKSETSEICITVINNTSDLRFNPGQEPNEEEKKILKQELKDKNLPITVFSFNDIDHAVKFLSGFYKDGLEVEAVRKLKEKYNMHMLTKCT